MRDEARGEGEARGEIKLPRRKALRSALLLLFLSALAVLWLEPAADFLEAAPGSTAVYDRQGRLLRLSLAKDERYRVIAPLSAYPPRFIEALLLKEDRWFYLHPGINPLALARAALHSLVLRDYRAGASTITMQLARLGYGYDTKALSGKLRQILDALRLEILFSKNAILRAYLARVPCGGNLEGFETASLAYFGKPLASLSLAESFLLASLPQRPSLPPGGRPGPALLASRDRLYELWLRTHPADEAARGQFALPVLLRPGLPFEAPHSVDYLLGSSLGAGPGPGAGLRPGEVPPRVDSTLDLDLERLLSRVLSSYVDRRSGEGIRNAAALLLDWECMEVLAEIGSADFFDASISGQVKGTEARRSPGSALKPFLYALAMEEGLIHPATVLKDSPIHFSGYNPDNFDRDFEGPIRAGEALVRSRNVPAVWLSQRVRDPDFHDFLKSAGLELKDKGWYGASLILGTAEVTMRELASLYAMLARSGRPAPLRFRLGEKLEPGPALLSPEASWLTLDILEGKPRPEVSAALLDAPAPFPCAWKTGTSIGFRDAWSVGVAGRFVLATWVGNFDGRGNPAFVGLTAAGPLMFEILDALKTAGVDYGRLERPRPAGLSRVSVCAASGKIPTELCPRKIETWFIPGVSPIERCEVHELVYVDLETGLRRRNFEEGKTSRELMEIWPSDILGLFQKAGLPRKSPPPYAEGEYLGGSAEPGAVPEILSPLARSEYVIREGAEGGEIPLVCVVPSDASRVFWFLDETFLGFVKPGQAYFWKPRPGEFTLRAIDDRGRSAACRFRIVLGGDPRPPAQ